MQDSSTSTAPWNVGFENAPEQREPIELRVEGVIPPWLEGALFRTGPGTTSVPVGDNGETLDIQHWFDGFTMHHRFDILPPSGANARSSRVTYRNRKGAEDLEQRVKREGKYDETTFGQRKPKDPCETIFNKFTSTYQRAASSPSPSAATGSDSKLRYPTPSSANVNVTLTPDMPGFSSHSATKNLQGDAFSNYIVAKTDGNVLQILDATTLEPLSVTNYKELDSTLNGAISAAHSTRDPVTGDLYNFNLKFGPKPTYTVFRISNGKAGEPDGKLAILAEIEGAPPAYLHSFAMTGKYVVLAVWQADFMKMGMSVLTSGSLLGGIEKKWDPSRKTEIFVIDRHNGGVVARYTTPAFFCFHQLNAFDDGDDVVMDLAYYKTHQVLELNYLDSLRAPTLPTNPPPESLNCYGRRFRLAAVSSQSPSGSIPEAEIQWTSRSPIELATIHPHKYHQAYRYAYGVTNFFSQPPGQPRQLADGLIKLDVHTLEEKVWRRDGYTAGEPIFVPRPGSVREDDGVLLSVVLDAVKGSSALVVVDATSMREVGRAEMDRPFPLGFHGAWRGSGGPKYAAMAMASRGETSSKSRL